MTKPISAKKSDQLPTEHGQTDDLAIEIDRMIGSNVPQKQREVIVERLTRLMISESFTGPLPHPRHLRGYEETSPGAAERIIAMAESRQKHHEDMDRRVLDAEKSDRDLGMWLGAGAFTLLVVSALISALILESEIIPGLFLGAAALGAVGLFVKGRTNGN